MENSHASNQRLMQSRSSDGCWGVLELYRGLAMWGEVGGDGKLVVSEYAIFLSITNSESHLS
jgi:hypothetical protein